VNYMSELRAAHAANGAKGVAGMITIVVSELARSEGRYDFRNVYGTFCSNGHKAYWGAFSFAYTLMANSIYYHNRDKTDTPLKQIRQLNEVFRTYKDFQAELPDDGQFLFDAVEYAVDLNLQMFLTEQEELEKKRERIGSQTVTHMGKTAKWIDHFGIDGTNIRKLKQQAIVAKLRS